MKLNFTKFLFGERAGKKAPKLLRSPRRARVSAPCWASRTCSSPSPSRSPSHWRWPATPTA